MAGRVGLVTGGAAGIGKTHVLALLKEGIKVCFADVQIDEGRDLEKELATKYGDQTVSFIPCDVSNSSQIQELFAGIKKTFGRLDIIVNNAGILDEHHSRKTIEINLLGTMEVSRQGIEYMGTHTGGKGGVVINTASLGAIRPLNIAPAYAAAKFGILGYTLALGALSEQLYGVRMNVLCPGRVQTAMLDLSGKTIDEDLYTEYCAAEGGPVLGPESVADAVLQLIKDESLSGRAMMCTAGHPHTLLTMPETTQDILDHFVTPSTQQK